MRSEHLCFTSYLNSYSDIALVTFPLCCAHAYLGVAERMNNKKILLSQVKLVSTYTGKGYKIMAVIIDSLFRKCSGAYNVPLAAYSKTSYSV